MTPAGPLRGVFALPPGVDFPRLLVRGLLARFHGQPPEALARVTLYVNTRRMQRRIAEILAEDGARLLPRLRLVTDPGLAPLRGLPPPIPPLRRRLELMQLVQALLARDPGLAPAHAAYDLADSLATLMDEMQGEGVPPAALAALDTAGHARHWQRSLAFIDLITPYFEAGTPSADPQARLRAAIDRLAATWATTPPDHPVLVAGSTGSRGTTARLMEAVAKLPQGALILPGFDFDMPHDAWEALDDALTAEDHPQYRHRALLDRLGLAPADIPAWEATPPPNPTRNRLISLALRPAPVTDRWTAEGARFGPLAPATDGLTLLEAPSPRAEARAIALILRHAAQEGRTAALITPDRGLTRQVAAALDRWRLVPDDSGGRPLGLTAPGRLLRQTARLRAGRVTVEGLIALLKHPLTHSGPGRGEHLRHTRDLELRLRRHGPAFPDGPALRAWARAGAKTGVGADAAPWGDWLADWLDRLPAPDGPAPLAEHVAAHIALTESLAAGAPTGPSPPDAADSAPANTAPETAAAQTLSTAREIKGDGIPAPQPGKPRHAAAADAPASTPSDRDMADPPPGHPPPHRAPGTPPAGALWDEAAGAEARAALSELAREAPHGGALGPAEYAALLDALLARREVREPVQPDPRIRIWGTLEARVQGAELVIAAGLNEGIWPDLPAPDPWLNRRMRLDAGLLLPERRIGLAAHDFQQAVCAPQVILTRALRDAEAATIPSRWLNRLTNLLAGLPAQGGPDALAAMRARGARWLALAEAVERPAAPTPPAPRPAPCPPLSARPTRLSVTEIETLIRDPYAIYARHALRLRPLDPLHPAPDALLRGTVLHRIIEQFVRGGPDPAPDPAPDPDRAAARARLRATAEAVLTAEVPWPAARRLWLARLMRVADWFLDREATRPGTPIILEKRGEIPVPPTGLTLVARPDRIDELPDGRLEILDYKTGSPPTQKQQQHFAKQLLLEAAMAERGAFAPLGPREVARVAYLGLGTTPKEDPTAITPDLTARVWDELGQLLTRYASPTQGYPARRIPFREDSPGDYDHLARFGEWDMTDTPTPIPLAPVRP
ncbi:MAG: double-strand break repair protein AddB [Alkalilacustris sp.]